MELSKYNTVAIGKSTYTLLVQSFVIFLGSSLKMDLPSQNSKQRSKFDMAKNVYVVTVHIAQCCFCKSNYLLYELYIIICYMFHFIVINKILVIFHMSLRLIIHNIDEKLLLLMLKFYLILCLWNLSCYCTYNGAAFSVNH